MEFEIGNQEARVARWVGLEVGSKHPSGPKGDYDVMLLVKAAAACETTRTLARRPDCRD